MSETFSRELTELISQYKETFPNLSEKDKAELEHRLWNLVQIVPAEKGEFRSKREWAVNRLGGTGADYEHRSALLLAGPWVSPLWQMLEDKVARHTVIGLFRQTKDLVKANKGMAHADALQRVIESFQSRGIESRTAEGHTFRKNNPSRPPSADFTPMDMDDPQGHRSKQFVKQLTALIDEFIRTSLPSSSPIEEMSVKIAKEDLISFIREASEDFRRRVYITRAVSKKERERLARVTRDDLRAAAEVLGIQVVWDRDVDLKVAKKIMLRRCAQLHPDQTGPMSDPRKIEYTAVVNAYKTLERYMEGRKPNEAGERNHEGQ